MEHFHLYYFKPNDEEAQEITLPIGDVLFVLGANGTGKSAFLTHVNTKGLNVKRILAHRQVSFESNGIELVSSQLEQYRTNINYQNSTYDSRWKTNYLQFDSQITLSDIINAENYHAREFRKAYNLNNQEDIQKYKETPSKLFILNKLLKLSNLKIQIAIGEDGKLYATKDSSTRYSVAKLSDGEKNALFLISDVLTAPPNTLILIDEPERHLHRSIISPLITQLLQEKKDCAFVVATHDINLPIDNPSAKVLLIRSCEWENEGTFCSWDANLLESQKEIDDKLKHDILGSRQKLLFVEGNNNTSLDYQLYTILFPEISVIPKGDCRNVIDTVKALTNEKNKSLQWIEAYGIIDADGRSPSDIETLKGNSIFALPCYSVESLYYSIEVLKKMAERIVGKDSGKVEEKLKKVEEVILKKMGEQNKQEMLCSFLCERTIRKNIGYPTNDQIKAKKKFNPYKGSHYVQNEGINLGAYLATEIEDFASIVENKDIKALISRYPMKINKKNALGDEIAEALGYAGHEVYEDTVRDMMQEDDEFRKEFIKRHFSDLSRAIQTN
jgi:ABC-type lipoprotein export system ATPase subunit